MKITADWLTRPETRAVCDMLVDAGHQALFVGGCVRNALIGAPVADLDIATDARPETVTVLAEKAGLRVVPTGIDHGTVTVVSGGLPHEVTTFRRDVETFGRHAVVAYATSVAEDAARRDFTMNALYATPDGTVIDPMDGLGDLTARRVRFVGDAHTRIREDFLRILRFFRFHAWYGDPQGGLDPEGLAACAAHSAETETLSRERVGAEMRKLLSAPDPAPSVAAMQQAGVLAHVLPGADARALPVLVHLDHGAPVRWLRRLAVLGGQDLTDRLRLSRAEATDLARLKGAVDAGLRPAEAAYRLGADLAFDAVAVGAALAGTALPPGVAADLARGAAARFPLRAADLMPGLQGAALGAALTAAEDRWIASDFTLTRDQLLPPPGKPG